jgi:ferrochelatase
MRYGSPSIETGLDQLQEMGCDRVLVLPLFPQYSASTTAASFDGVADVLRRRRSLPEIRMVRDYHDHPGYISALASSIREAWADHPPAELLLMSFHGIPKRYADRGDPYPEHCAATARLLAESLGLENDRWRMTFQSRFGPEEWLTPYTDETLEALGRNGVGVDTVCPGFAADCLETLEEMAITNRELYEEAGGARFRYLPALNDRPDHIAALADIAANAMSGWLEAPDPIP